MYDRSRIARIRQLPIATTEKGFGGPAHGSELTAAELVGADTRAGAGLLGTPRAQVRETALRHNVVTMADYCARRGVTLFPHGKTTMAPQLWAMQLDAGAGGITVATVPQARVARAFGVRSVLIANEVVDAGGAQWLAAERQADPDVSVLCYVDSVDGVELLAHSMRAQGPAGRLRVLLEVGHERGRTGVRSEAAAMEVADAVAREATLELAGVAGYEGSIVTATVEETLRSARRYLERLGELAQQLVSRARFEALPVVSAGGSAYFDVVVDALGGGSDWELVLRSGCYLVHDHGLYSRISPFERTELDGRHLQAALEVLAPVLSVPEPGVAVLGVGRRDLSFDAGNPVVLTATNGEPATALSVERMFDQHSVVAIGPGAALSVGEEVRLGVSHPCTTFDKWRWIPLVADDDHIVDVIRTYF